MTAHLLAMPVLMMQIGKMRMPMYQTFVAMSVAMW
jgi:hypothetical protein